MRQSSKLPSSFRAEPAVQVCQDEQGARAFPISMMEAVGKPRILVTEGLNSCGGGARLSAEIVTKEGRQQVRGTVAPPHSCGLCTPSHQTGLPLAAAGPGRAKDVRKGLGQGKRPFLGPLGVVGERKVFLVFYDLSLHYPIVFHRAIPASLY